MGSRCVFNVLLCICALCIFPPPPHTHTHTYPSSLFADVVNCMQTDNLELKKLVYLYLMNYAKSQPDLAILAVNTFSKDCEDPNPLIRALAVRTMGCIRVDKITEYLCEPLRKCLKVSKWTVRLKGTVSYAVPLSFARTMIPTSARRLRCVLPSSTTSMPSWWRTRDSWTCSRICSLTPPPWSWQMQSLHSQRSPISHPQVW